MNFGNKGWVAERKMGCQKQRNTNSVYRTLASLPIVFGQNATYALYWRCIQPDMTPLTRFTTFSVHLIYLISAFLPMPTQLANPFYYLDNFRMLLDWVATRYADLQDAQEARFIAEFAALPRPAQALLVRLIMRKGELFRQSKLAYPEIGPCQDAVAPLIAHGWVDPLPQLDLRQLFRLFTKAELAQLLAPSSQSPQSPQSSSLAAVRQLNKEQQLASLLADPAWAGLAQPLPAWSSAALAQEPVYGLQIGTMVDRLRLMFFGNLHADWSEFVLADLGIYRFESVDIAPDARGFQARADLEHYLALYQWRSQWQEDGDHAALLAKLAQLPVSAQSWLEQRRARLHFQVGQVYERNGELAAALDLYRNNPSPGARVRHLRVLIQQEQWQAAQQLAEQALAAPESEAEAQQLARIWPRLLKKLAQSGQLDPSHPASRFPAVFPAAGPAALPGTLPQGKGDWPVLQLHLPAPDGERIPSVEFAVLHHLHAAQAPVFYVENTLINSLFGLLCWDAIFAALPGAFFHPYQHGPADLHSSDFYPRRQAIFDAALAQLHSDDWQATVRRNFVAKAGIQSPFVYWQVLSEPLLELALHCLPGQHLHPLFCRMLADLSANRSGFPDLIRFWPDAAAGQRYQMLEVKGPGDRLQDNQLRWLHYCEARQIPVAVCHVSYRSADDEPADEGTPSDGDLT
jgi:hypothetical protein